MAGKLSNRFLTFGLTLVLVGIALLTATLGVFPMVAPLWPLILVILGVRLLYLGITGKSREAAVFTGLFLVLVGTLFLLLTTVMSTVELRRIWPLFMTIAGISLAGYAYRSSLPQKLNLTVPAYVIIFLSLVFLLFSFDIVDGDFTGFVRVWWPVVFIVAGLALLFMHFRGRTAGHTDGDAR